jgi:integrase/recombinase XerD
MTVTGRFTSAFGPTIRRYIALKEALGCQYTAERRTLQHLDRFLAARGLGRGELTSQAFDRWCQTFLHLRSGVRRKWMLRVRNLCLYRRRTDAAYFVPDRDQFPVRHQPLGPHIFQESDVARLLRLADSLEPSPGSRLRPHVFRLGLVLFYSMGLRRAEVVRLTIRDYDPRHETLLIRESKFHKSRLLPLSPDGTRELREYLIVRARHRIPSGPDAPLLCNSLRHGGFYTAEGFANGVRALLHAAGIRTPQRRRPRVHDFRHTFAVHALVRWYRSGADVRAKLPLLAKYMGHVSIASTEYYLAFVEPLATLASERFARRCSALVRSLGGGAP